MTKKRANEMEVDQKKAGAVREALIGWFDANGRDLPWRHTRDPWHILVSEVMLQQIQVKRAVPFYERFLNRFPTLRDLADAPLADAIRIWGDLGRYRRVVNLHRTARMVAEEHDGQLPSDPEILVELPGIGPYTAGAVACFAFERDVHFLDTNMHRVLHRVFFGPDVPEPRTKAKEILALAADLVPANGGWTWNQAVMEFGAMRCTARRPLCEDCPLQTNCEAHPGMLQALAAVPREPKNEQTVRYEDTNRYLRGRILAHLREDAASRGVSLKDLGESVLGDTTDHGLLRMREVVGTLENDGLARVLPANDPPEAVAEERAAYDAGVPSGVTEDLATLRVALP